MATPLRAAPRVTAPPAPVLPPWKPKGHKVPGIGRIRVSAGVAWAGGGAIFLALSRLHQQIAPLGAIRSVMLLNIVALALLVSSTGQWRPGDFSKSWVARYVSVIAVFAVVGIPFALYPGKAFTFLQDAYSRTLLLAVIAWAISRTPDGLRFLARLVILACLTCALNAILVGRRDGAGRLSGAYTYDPNDIALICVAAVPLVIWWGLDKSSRWRWIALVALPAFAYVIIESGSRGGFLGLSAIMIGFLGFALRGDNKRLKKLGRLAVVMGILGFPLLPPEYRDIISTIRDENDYNRTSPTGRIQVWKRGMGYAFDHPIVGVGLANFQTAEGWISPLALARQPGQGLKWSTAHNSFIQLTAELGLVPGAYFLTLILRLAWTLCRWESGDRKKKKGQPKKSRGPPEIPFGALFGLAFVGYGVSGFFLSFAYYDIIYVMLGMASALILQRDEEEKWKARQLVRAQREAARPRRAPARVHVAART